MANQRLTLEVVQSAGAGQADITVRFDIASSQIPV